jgi:hypothetical protein
MSTLSLDSQTSLAPSPEAQATSPSTVPSRERRRTSCRSAVRIATLAPSRETAGQIPARRSLDHRRLPSGHEKATTDPDSVTVTTSPAAVLPTGRYPAGVGNCARPLARFQIRSSPVGRDTRTASEARNASGVKSAISSRATRHALSDSGATPVDSTARHDVDRPATDPFDKLKVPKQVFLRKGIVPFSAVAPQERMCPHVGLRIQRRSCIADADGGEYQTTHPGAQVSDMLIRIGFGEGVGGGAQSRLDSRA